MTTVNNWHGHKNWLVLPVGAQAPRGGMYCNDCGRKVVEDESIEEGTAKREENVTRIHPLTAQDLNTLREEYRNQLPPCG